jgi:hypothetical protein
MPIDFKGVEDALRQWVLDASALPESQVIFSHQNGNDPVAPYITVQLDDEIGVGLDSVRTIYDEDADEGEEIELRSEGLRELVVTVQAYSDDTTGASSARALLSKVRAALGLPTVRSKLATAELACFDAGNVRNLSALYEADFEGRAVLEARFYVPQTASEKTGYISQVEITNEIPDPDQTFTVDLPDEEEP